MASKPPAVTQPPVNFVNPFAPQTLMASKPPAVAGSQASMAFGSPMASMAYRHWSRPSPLSHQGQGAFTIAPPHLAAVPRSSNDDASVGSYGSFASTSEATYLVDAGIAPVPLSPHAQACFERKMSDMGLSDGSGLTTFQKLHNVDKNLVQDFVFLKFMKSQYAKYSTTPVVAQLSIKKHNADLNKLIAEAESLHGNQQEYHEKLAEVSAETDELRRRYFRKLQEKDGLQMLADNNHATYLTKIEEADVVSSHLCLATFLYDNPEPLQ